MIAWPAWPVPLACALVPALAVHVAWWVSVDAGYIPDCIPYLEGCASISRAARHGDGNLVFRFLVIPCALLQAIHWALARDWLRLRDPATGRAILVSGVIAGVALAVYATFLGTEGAVYGWMRRFGITFYFGATFIALALFARGLDKLGLHRRLARGLFAVCLAMLALGIASVAVKAAIADGPSRDALENILEWNLGIFLVAGFVLHSWLWRASSFKVRLYA